MRLQAGGRPAIMEPVFEYRIQQTFEKIKSFFCFFDVEEAPLFLRFRSGPAPKRNRLRAGMARRRSVREKASRERRPRRVPGAAAPGIKSKSVISRDMCLGNDTSHGGRGDSFVKNRAPPAMGTSSKKAQSAFFESKTASAPEWRGGDLRFKVRAGRTGG